MYNDYRTKHKPLEPENSQLQGETMDRYRIKSKQRNKILNLDFEDHGVTLYYVQYKILWFWITITTAFTTLKQAEEHIELKLKEKYYVKINNKTI